MRDPAHYNSSGAHKESQETKDFIADWITPDFFFSKKDVWHRFGMLGVFGDFVLSCTPGDIAEIGVGESSIYLTHLARKWSRKTYHCDIAPGKIINPSTVDGYLTPKALNLELKSDQAYQDDRYCFFTGASDRFFTDVKISPLALVFIDGDHRYEQVEKDFFNFVPYVVDNGYILLHDTYPPNEEYLSESRCGTVYALRQEIERDGRFDCITLPRGCAIGVGLTIVRKKPKERPFYNE